MRPVNLLPDEHRPRRSSDRMAGSAYLLVAALGALVVGLLVYTLFANQVNSRHQQAAKAEHDAAVAEQKAGALGAFGDFASIKQARLDSVRELAGSRFDWERMLREVSRVLPTDAWLTEIDAAAASGGTSGSGSSSSSSTSSASAGDVPANPSGGPSARLAGCARRQSEVAKLMVRLRKLHAVDDVSLSESAKSDSGGSSSSSGSAGGDCGRYYAFDLDVDFDLQAVLQPGAPSRVPASLGGGS